MESSKSLVLVIGAGASREANVPDGEEVKRRIARLLDIRFVDGYQQSSGDYRVVDALRRMAAERGERDVNPLFHVCWHIRDAMPQAISIDNFIESHRNNPQIAACGKIGIAKAILDGEAESLLSVHPNHSGNSLEFEALTSTWYDRFFRLLSEGCDFNEYSARLTRVAIVSFNYDRCIEHFLFYATQNYYRVTPAEAARALQQLEVFHPYGMVGSLPWMDTGAGTRFGETPSGAELLGLSRQLHTFTEGTDPSRSDILRLRAVVYGTRRLAFLGYAFHPLNMDLLLPVDAPARSTNGPLVLATAFGMSTSDCEKTVTDLTARLSTLAGRVTLRQGLTCVNLFDEYRRALAIDRV